MKDSVITDQIRRRIIQGYKQGYHAEDLVKKIKILSKWQIAAIKAHHTMGTYKDWEVDYAEKS